MREAIEHGRATGLVGAAEALEEITRRRHDSRVFHAIVRELARQQAEDAAREFRVALN